MKAVDSSVVIRAFQPEFFGHAAALSVLAAAPSLPAHAAVETYSALTRMPDPHRVHPVAAAEMIDANFRGRLLAGPTPSSITNWLRRMADAGIGGGSIYDALIAESARLAKATLVTADRRAAATYEAVGLEVEILAS